MNLASVLIVSVSSLLVLSNAGCASQRSAAAAPQLRTAQTFTASDTVVPITAHRVPGTTVSPRPTALRHFYLLSPGPQGALVVTERE